MRTREAVAAAAGLRLSLSLPCFYAAANAAGVQFITVMYHLLRGEGWRESKGGREGGRERSAGMRTMPTRRCELDSWRANYEMTLATFRLCQISFGGAALLCLC